MPVIDTTLLLLIGSFALGIGATWFVARKLRGLRSGRNDRVEVQTIAERVRAVGRLVGLEVCAKEIATATAGFAWLPPVLLTQARLAMIFNFEKRYGVDLSRVRPRDVAEQPDGTFRVALPPIEGALRLIDVVPYDIQNARVLGLLDVIPMTAERQKTLMTRAQQQAAELFAVNDARYTAEARASIERQLSSLLALFNVRVELEWKGEPGRPAPAITEPSPEPRLPAHRERALTGAAA